MQESEKNFKHSSQEAKSWKLFSIFNRNLLCVVDIIIALFNNYKKFSNF